MIGERVEGITRLMESNDPESVELGVNLFDIKAEDIQNIPFLHKTDGIGMGEEVTFYKSAHGVDIQKHGYEILNAIDMVDWLEEMGAMNNAEEKENLINLLRAPDLESFNLGIQIIKTKQHVITGIEVHSKDS